MDNGTIDVHGINPAALLAALYNASQPLGMGMLHFDPKPMTTEEAQHLLDSSAKDPQDGVYFDYLKGRVMKVRVGKPVLETWLYDRDNGPGAAQKVVEALRGKK